MNVIVGTTRRVYINTRLKIHVHIWLLQTLQIQLLSAKVLRCTTLLSLNSLLPILR